MYLIDDLALNSFSPHFYFLSFLSLFPPLPPFPPLPSLLFPFSPPSLHLPPFSSSTRPPSLFFYSLLPSPLPLLSLPFSPPPHSQTSRLVDELLGEVQGLRSQVDGSMRDMEDKVNQLLMEPKCVGCLTASIRTNVSTKYYKWCVPPSLSSLLT